MLRRVEPALAACPVRCRILLKMVLKLLSVQERGKELLEGDFPRSLWIVREAVAKPPLGKALRPRRRIEHAQRLLRRHEKGLVTVGSLVEGSKIPLPNVSVQLPGSLS